MNGDFAFACEVQDFSKRRYALASYRPGNAGTDQVCRVARENNTDVNTGLLSPPRQMEWDRRLRWVVRSPGCRDRQHLLHGSPLLSGLRPYGKPARSGGRPWWALIEHRTRRRWQ